MLGALQRFPDEPRLGGARQDAAREQPLRQLSDIVASVESRLGRWVDGVAQVLVKAVQV